MIRSNVNERKSLEVAGSGRSDADGVVVRLSDVERATVAAVGGKGASLAKLSLIEGIHVPAGFCITTAAYRRIRASVPGIDGDLPRLGVEGRILGVPGWGDSDEIRGRDRVRSGEQGDIDTSGNEPFGQQRGELLPWPVVTWRDPP